MEIKTKYNLGEHVFCLLEAKTKLASFTFGEIIGITAWTEKDEIMIKYKIQIGYCKSELCFEKNIFKSKEDFIENIRDNFREYFEEE